MCFLSYRFFIINSETFGILSCSVEKQPPYVYALPTETFLFFVYLLMQTIPLPLSRDIMYSPF